LWLRNPWLHHSSTLIGMGLMEIMNLKDWLDIVVIPIVLVLIALFWPLIQNWHRCRIFTKLVFRELPEIGPHSIESERENWTGHLSKNFVHRAILNEVSQNRDFVLSLNPDLVYYLSQLWDAYEARDEEQWLYFLAQLAKLDKTGQLKEVHADWDKLCNRYGKKGK
jgi:hypothetical protein